jgi:tetratricopeptide (TPR) repeat protein
MRIMLFAVLLVADAALAQAPDTKEASPRRRVDGGWKHQIVMSKQGILSFRKIDRYDDDNNPVYSETIAGEISFVVRDERDGQVLLRTSAGMESWFDKEALVPIKDAPAHFGKMIEDNPDSAIGYIFRSHAYERNDKLDDALRDMNEAIRLLPEATPLLAARGAIHYLRKDYDQALKDINDALRQSPTDPHMLLNRSLVRLRKIDYPGAIRDVEAALKQDDKNALAHNQLAWVLATCPDADVRDGRRAVKHAEKAVELSERKVGSILDTLAAAYAEVGRFDDAVRTQQEAINDREFLVSNGNAVSERVDLYRQKKAYREK